MSMELERGKVADSGSELEIDARANDGRRLGLGLDCAMPTRTPTPTRTTCYIAVRRQQYLPSVHALDPVVYH